MDAKAKVVRWGPPQGTVSMQCEEGAFVLYDDHEAALAEELELRMSLESSWQDAERRLTTLLAGLEALAGEMREEMKVLGGGSGSVNSWKYDTLEDIEKRIRTLASAGLEGK